MEIWCCKETTGQKYCMIIKLEKNSFQTMPFEGKLEQRRLKYRNSKIADFAILSWTAARCLLNGIFWDFRTPKGIIKSNRMDLQIVS